MEGGNYRSVGWTVFQRLRYLASVGDFPGGSQTIRFLDTTGIDITALGSTTIRAKISEILEIVHLQ